MTINVTLTDLVNLTNETTAVTAINDNSSAIETGFNSALNIAGDTMSGSLNMNNQRIYNLSAPGSGTDPLRLTDASVLNGGGTITVNTNMTVGSTPINSGTSGEVFYDNGGILGQIPTTGTGNVVLETSPTIASPNFTGSNFLALSNLPTIPSGTVLGNLSGSTGNVTTVSGSQIAALNTGLIPTLRGTYGMGDASFNVDATWAGCFNIVQPATANVVLFNLPSVASIQAAGNPLSLYFKNNTPGAGPGWDGTKVAIVANGTDTIDGNPNTGGTNEVNIAWCLRGDESINILSDAPGVSTSNWNLVNRSSVYSQRIYTPQVNPTTSLSSFTNYTLVPGFQAQLPQMLQSLSSTEEVDFEFIVASSSVNDIVTCTLSQGGVATLGSLAGGSGYVNGTYNGVHMTGTGATGMAQGLICNIVVSGGAVSSVTIANSVQPSQGGVNYTIGDVLSAPASALGGTGSGFSIAVATILYVDIGGDGLDAVSIPVINMPYKVRLHYRVPGQLLTTMVPSIWKVYAKAASGGSTVHFGSANSITYSSCLDIKEFSVN